jgi:hypothetical protein
MEPMGLRSIGETLRTVVGGILSAITEKDRS